AGNVVDLSYSVSERFPNWEGSAKSPFHAETMATIEKGGYFTRNYSLPEHFGTHLDAPAHFGRGQLTLDKLGPEKLFVPTVVLDVRAPSANNADYELTAADVEA